MTTETTLSNSVPSTQEPEVSAISLPTLPTQLTGQQANEPAFQLGQQNPLLRLKAEVQVRVGKLDISIGELISARLGDILDLETGLEDSVDLLIDHQVIARGQLVAVDDRFGVRITELPIDFKL